MKFNLAIVGFGVIGVETLHKITEKINKSKKFNIAVIEKDLKNIPGGVAYSKLNSKFGFFNNPLRLSHPSFKSWINNKKNIYKIIDFINRNPTYRLKNWLSIGLLLPLILLVDLSELINTTSFSFLFFDFFNKYL